MVPIFPASENTKSGGQPTPVAPAPTERLWIRMGIFVVSGLLVGLFGALCTMALIVVSISQEQPQLPVLNIVQDPFRFVLFREGVGPVFLSGLLGGAAGGLVTAFLPRKMRHPFALASFWASSLGTVALLIFLAASHRTADEVAIFTAIWLGLGAAFGFALGFIARWMQRRLDRFYSVGQNGRPFQ
jgi:hypothetical protein